MTLEELREEVDQMLAANAEAWETCCNLADMPYFGGFDAACARVLDLIDGREADDGEDI